MDSVIRTRKEEVKVRGRTTACLHKSHARGGGKRNATIVWITHKKKFFKRWGCQHTGHTWVRRKMIFRHYRPRSQRPLVARRKKKRLSPD